MKKHVRNKERNWRKQDEGQGCRRKKGLNQGIAGALQCLKLEKEVVNNMG